jgi:hypothetical protein
VSNEKPRYCNLALYSRPIHPYAVTWNLRLAAGLFGDQTYRARQLILQNDATVPRLHDFCDLKAKSFRGGLTKKGCLSTLSQLCKEYFEFRGDKCELQIDVGLTKASKSCRIHLVFQLEGRN